jgi:purine-binding chemotaxis protein CheW
MTERGRDEALASRADVLSRRALALAKVETDENRRKIVDTVVILQVAGEKLGIPITSLREITPLRPAADIAGLPAWCRGIVQVRGEILSVLDLHKWLSLGGVPAPRYLAVLEGKPGAIAVLVDAVLDVAPVYEDDIASSFEATPGRGRRAVTRDLTTLLDVSVMLEAAELTVDQDPEPSL